MINRAQITRQAARDGVPVLSVEWDYVLSHIIAALGVRGDSHGLVFKGGTQVPLPTIIGNRELPGDAFRPSHRSFVGQSSKGEPGKSSIRIDASGGGPGGWIRSLK